MRTAPASIARRLVTTLLAGMALALAGSGPLPAEKIKSLSGKIRRVEGHLITIKKSGLLGSSEVEVRMTDDTKKHGQITPGMHIKVKYREEKTADGETRLIAVEVEARPEFASKNAKKLQKRDP